MNNNLSTLGYNDINEFSDKITKALSGYEEKTVNRDGSINYTKVKTSYFLENDDWHISFFGGIPQFKEQVDNHKHSGRSIAFHSNNPNINKEIKFIVYNKLFSEEWRLYTIFMARNQSIKRLSEFIDEKYPNVNSILDIDLHKSNLKWIDWLNGKGIKTMSKRKVMETEYQNRTSIATFLEYIYESLFHLTDNREEWEKDVWDVRNLEDYGINYNKSTANYYIDFTKIDNLKIRDEVKKYFKQRMINKHKFSFGTARKYLVSLPKFLNLIYKLEPSWNNLKKLERHHIEKYIEWLNIYTKRNSTQKNSNSNGYIADSLDCIQKFLSDIQLMEYEIAPIKNVRKLIFPTDKPVLKKRPYDQIDYIPDVVLEQLFVNINYLHKEVIPIVWAMYKTGLRISDALGLRQDCLVKLNNKFWIETDIEKTYVEGHRIPIDDGLANMLAVLIDLANKSSNEDNNPESYIFVRYTGRRKGRPYSQAWVQLKLNELAVECNITDELGNRYHFKNHAFRHNYAINLLNGGADILTVQELLAHSSPEMTMRYARLLDDTKRKAFDNAVKQGVFSFDEGAKLREENNGEIPADVLDMLWTNHKLNAIDTPYGTCLQRTNGKCSFAKQPPCLTCNGGNPCRDLCVGAFEGDIQKYEILINSTKSMIQSAKVHNRVEMAKENEEILNLYEDIYSKIREGNIIYSRLDRLIKQGDKNE